MQIHHQKERLVLTTPMLKKYTMKGANQSGIQSSVNVAQSMAMLEDKVISLNDLMKFSDQDLKKITFEIVDAT